MTKPLSEACERNRGPILEVIKPLLTGRRSVLELGSGTGQHAVYFAEHMPWLTWQASDLPENLPGIRAWLDEAALGNTPPPRQLDVSLDEWPQSGYDAVFSANAVHIMAWEKVKDLVAGAAAVLGEGGLLILYGPFNYGNNYTSDSNRQFDSWLKLRDPDSGIRNFEDLDALAAAAGMAFREDHEMPSNNRILCWQRIGQPVGATPRRD